MHELTDLRPGMLLEGVVTNVAAFGAFVDVGVHQDGLVHVSALSKNYVSDPREVVKSGDVVRVKVLDVDVPRKRIALTLRLDDEVRPGGGGGRDRRDGGNGGGTGGGQRPPRQQRGADQRRGGGGNGGNSGGGNGGGSADTALADALRRAGLVK